MKFYRTPLIAFLILFAASANAENLAKAQASQRIQALIQLPLGFTTEILTLGTGIPGCLADETGYLIKSISLESKVVDTNIACDNGTETRILFNNKALAMAPFELLAVKSKQEIPAKDDSGITFMIFSAEHFYAESPGADQFVSANKLFCIDERGFYLNGNVGDTLTQSGVSTNGSFAVSFTKTGSSTSFVAKQINERCVLLTVHVQGQGRDSFGFDKGGGNLHLDLKAYGHATHQAQAPAAPIP